MQQDTGLSIVIPVKNEEQSISFVLNEIIDVFAKFEDVEIIVVDDGSQDNTKKIINNFKNEKTNIKLIESYPSKGQSNSIGIGILQSNHRFIGILDGDGQNDPKDIMVMWQKLIDSPTIDMFHGNRYPNRKDNFLRIKLSSVANAIARKVINIRLNDLGCATKVFKREIALEIPFRGEIHRIYAAHALKLGYSVREISVNHRTRVGGVSKYGFNRIWKFILDVIFLKLDIWVMNRPYYALGSISILFMITSFMSLIIALSLKLLNLRQFVDASLVSLSIVMFSLSVMVLLMALIVERINKN